MRAALERLKTWFDRPPPLELTPPQREALMDAIVLAIMVDGKEELSEYQELIGNGKSWESGTDIASFFRDSKKRALSAMENTYEPYCVEINGRLETEEARELTFSVVASTVCSDGDLDPTEVELMATFARTFAIEKECADELVRNASTQHGII